MRAAATAYKELQARIATTDPYTKKPHQMLRYPVNFLSPIELQLVSYFYRPDPYIKLKTKE
jgi:hypothetical protein